MFLRSTTRAVAAAAGAATRTDDAPNITAEMFAELARAALPSLDIIADWFATGSLDDDHDDEPDHLGLVHCYRIREQLGAILVLAALAEAEEVPS